MSQQPWWFSGDETSEGARASGGGVDFGVLAMGASQVVEWARTLIVAPHAEHDDPREHPQCLICQATRIIGTPADSSSEPSPSRRVQWIDVEWR